MPSRCLLAVLAVLCVMSLSSPLNAFAFATLSGEDNVNAQASQSLDDYDHPRWNGAGLPPIDYMGN